MSATVTAEDPTQSLSLTALYEAPPSQAPTTVEDAVLFISLAARAYAAVDLSLIHISEPTRPY